MLIRHNAVFVALCHWTVPVQMLWIERQPPSGLVECDTILEVKITTLEVAQEQNPRLAPIPPIPVRSAGYIVVRCEVRELEVRVHIPAGVKDGALRHTVAHDRRDQEGLSILSLLCRLALGYVQPAAAATKLVLLEQLQQRVHLYMLYIITQPERRGLRLGRGTLRWAAHWAAYCR